MALYMELGGYPNIRLALVLLSKYHNKELNGLAPLMFAKVKIDRTTLSHIIKFLFVGGTATLLQMVLLAMAVEFDLLPPVTASAVGYGISAIYNYLLNYYLTFGSDKSHTETFPKFAIVTVIGLSVNTITFALMLGVVGHYLFAQIVAVAVTLIINFILLKYWIYRK